MTVATRRPARARSDRAARRPAGGVVAEIAARRIADLEPELARLGPSQLARAAATAPPPRDLAERLARPGLHLIAEVKRRSPSAGAIVDPGDDPLARARSYERGGASAISVLCEPHWFGGAIADLAAVRAAVSLPVLAKEFVVDVRQLPLLRAAGADAVLLLAVLHPARRLGALVDAALDLGLEPLVEAHDQRELERALTTRARLIGINNRDLRTLDVDPERAVRLRDLVPPDRLAIAESGVREPAMVAGWRAVGFDAALVGEALMRSADPAAAAHAFVAAGAFPDDPAVADRIPFVKICGVTDADGVRAAIRAGADAIGLNVVAGTPRALSHDEAGGAGRPDPHDRAGRGTATDRGDHRRHPARAAPGDRRRNRPGRGPAQRRRHSGLRGVNRPDDLEGASPAGHRAKRCPRGGRRRRRARSRLPRRGRGAGPARHGRRPPSGRNRHPIGRLACRGGRPRASGRARRRAVAGQRRSGDPRRPGRRGRRRLGRRGAPGSRRAAAQGSAPGRAVRQACSRCPGGSAARPGSADAGPSGPARGRCQRPVGGRPRVRRSVRAGDAHGGARGPRARLRRDPPGPPLLGRLPRAAGDLLRSPHADLPRRSAGRGDDGHRPRAPRRRPRGARPAAGDAPALPQARGPRSYRRPQDQQRARPGVAHPTARASRG